MAQTLRQELLSMAAEDDRVREELAREGALTNGHHPRMAEVHARNGRRIAELLARDGWPGRSRVGDDGARAAFLVVQHAIDDPALQRGALPLLEAAARAGDADRAWVAMLTDRIRFNEG